MEYLLLRRVVLAPPPKPWRRRVTVIVLACTEARRKVLACEWWVAPTPPGRSQALPRRSPTAGDSRWCHCEHFAGAQHKHQRSKLAGGGDCFVALAPRNDE